MGAKILPERRRAVRAGIRARMLRNASTAPVGSIANAVRTARLAANLTQSELGERAYTNRFFVNRLESEFGLGLHVSRSRPILACIERALGMTPGTLIPVPEITQREETAA